MQPISTALLSYGMSGKLFHAPFLHHHPGFGLKAVWERSKNLAAADYPDIITYRSIEELLSDESIELVVVNTPNATHFEYARLALQSGKHVLVEKPFVISTSEAEILKQLAEERGLVLSVYHNRRFDSDFLLLQSIVKGGGLGEVVEAALHFDRYRTELSAKAHKEDAGPGSGVLYDLGSHLIDAALHLFGLPQAVFADIRILRPNSIVDDYFELLLYYPRLRVRLHASYLVRQPLPSFVLHGTAGSFLKSRADVQESQLLRGVAPGSAGWGEEPEGEEGLLHTGPLNESRRKKLAAPTGNYLQYFDALYSSIRSGSAPPVSAEEGAAVIRIIEAAMQSNREERKVQI